MENMEECKSSKKSNVTFACTKRLKAKKRPCLKWPLFLIYLDIEYKCKPTLREPLKTYHIPEPHPTLNLPSPEVDAFRDSMR
jgi:hypothetical protein